MSELKPCPFCGGEATLASRGAGSYCIAHTENCYLAHVVPFIRPHAITAWNTRTTDTELTRLKRQVEVLSRGLRGLRETTTDNISEVRAENALAAADRIAKGEV